MSNRQVRKMFGDNTLPPPDSNSDEEYEPLYAQRSPSKYKYEELALSSNSNSEHESTGAVSDEDEPSDDVDKKKKKKKKQRKAKNATASTSKDNLEMDEIDKALEDVHAMLGTPPPSAPMRVMHTVAVDPSVELLAIHQKHLNAANELTRMLGPEPVDPKKKKRARQPNLNRLVNKALLVPMDKIPASFKRNGLSMSVLRREEGYTYFTFDHSRDYQRVHHAFLHSKKFKANDLMRRIDEAQHTMHVEGLLEGADMLFIFEEYTTAIKLVEEIISYMQHVAHPAFNITEKKIRLEYKHPENRSFHIAVFKYMHLMTNKACHRTALEMAKLLLKLDPCDPLAVLFIVDTLALRAREHAWLIKAIDYWSVVRDAGHLFNIQYSYALAHFHVARKAKGDLTHSDNLLQKAMANFPATVLMILNCAAITPEPRLKTHPVFATVHSRQTVLDVKDLMFLYAKLSHGKWREPPVLEWLLRNAREFVDNYDSDPLLQEAVTRHATEQNDLFRGIPHEMFRYLTSIASMSNLIADGAVPRVQRLHPNERSCDPAPPLICVDRYGYNVIGISSSPNPATSAIIEIFASLLPNYAFPEDLQDLAVSDDQREPRNEAEHDAEPEPVADGDMPINGEVPPEADNGTSTDYEPSGEKAAFYEQTHDKSTENKSTDDKSTDNKSKHDDKSTVSEPLDDKPTVYNQTDDKATVYEPTDDESKVFQQTDDKMTVNNPKDDNSAVYEPTDDQSTVYEPTDDKSKVYNQTDDKSTVYEPTDDKMIVNNPKDDNSAVYEPTDDQSTVYEPTNDKSKVYNPTDDKSTVYEPTDDKMTVNNPKDDNSAVYEPTDDQSTVYEPTDGMSTVYELTDDKSTVYKPTDDEPTDVADPHDVLASMGELIAAVRKFIDVCEAITLPLQEPANNQVRAGGNRTTAYMPNEEIANVGAQDNRQIKI